MTDKQGNWIGEAWRIVVVGVFQFIVAGFMAVWGQAYPPIPMFLAALLGGYLFRGRLRAAVRGGLIAGLTFGWATEAVYLLVRLQRPGYEAGLADIGNRLGLAAAETVLYAAMLAFFSAFVGWGADPNRRTAVPEAPAAGRDPVPFNPGDETETTVKRKDAPRT